MKDYSFNTYEDMKCIWMAGNLVEYKLCDKSFDCENCPFDKVIRNLCSEKITELETVVFGFERKDILTYVIDKLKNIKYDENLIYVDKKFILKHLFDETYYLGINPLMLALLDNITSVDYLNIDNNVSRSQSAFSLKGSWGSITFNSPFSMRIVEKLNFLEKRSSPHKWIALAAVNKESVNKTKLTGEEWKRQKLNVINMIEKYRYSYPEVGPTLQDGGKPLSFIYQLIGKKEYLNLLKSFT
jgi:glycine cleavage system H lipoate-binding protein